MPVNPLNPSPEWTLEERLAVIKRIADSIHIPFRYNDMFKIELIQFLTHYDAFYLELNRNNFKEFFDKETE